MNRPPTATASDGTKITGTTTDPLSYAAPGTYAVTWHYRDSNGNESTQTQTVIAKDTTAPVPDMATLPSIAGQCSATIAAPPTATDDCAGKITGTPTDPLTYTAQGTYTLTWHYNDGNGNESTQTQTVIVKDTTPPTIRRPADIAVGCSVDLLVPVSFTATATDNCDPSPAITYSPESGAGFPVGTTTVTCTATDASGNPSTCTFNVIRAPLAFSGFLAPMGGADATGGSFASPVRTFSWAARSPSSSPLPVAVPQCWLESIACRSFNTLPPQPPEPPSTPRHKTPPRRATNSAWPMASGCSTSTRRPPA